MKMKFIPLLTILIIILSSCVPDIQIPEVTPVSSETPKIPEIPEITATLIPTTETKSSTTASPGPTETLSPEDAPPIYASIEFSTDFSIHSVPYTEIRRGGPSKDGIPAIDNPTFFTVQTADGWLKENEPVIFIESNHDARAYPLQVMVFHEIVNDTIGDIPITITYCPLCNSAIAFKRTLDDQVLDFGTTGRLRYSNLIMYDRQTESWWQQAEGKAIAGTLTGFQLEFYPVSIISWLDFKTNYPEGKILSYNTGFDAPYGISPYVSYDHPRNQPLFYKGPDTPDVLSPLERVLGVSVAGETVAFPFTMLKKSFVIQDDVGGTPVVIFWQPNTFSVLDEQFVWDSRDVGTAISFENSHDPILHFHYDGEFYIDEETESTWNFLGQAIAGPLQGEELKPILSFNHFWFSWSAFNPETRVFLDQ